MNCVWCFGEVEKYVPSGAGPSDGRGTTPRPERAARPPRKGVSRRDLDGAVHAPVDAVERALVAHDELAVPVEEVRVARRDEGVVGEDELAVAADDVLVRVQLVALRALDPLAADGE